MDTCVKGHKVDCIWFKSLDCGGTIALLNTHCSCSYSVAQCSTHSTTHSITRLPSLDSNSFLIHTASAIRLAPNKHNKQRRQYIPLPSLLVKWKLKQHACSFSELDTRITWNVSSETHHMLHYIPFVTYTVIKSRILPWVCQLTWGTIDTWAQTKFSFFTRNWNCLNASTNGMPSMSPIVPPNSIMHTWNESMFFLNFWYMAPTEEIQSFTVCLHLLVAWFHLQ